MQASPTELPGVMVLEPTVRGDDRGWFFEAYNARDFAAAVGRRVEFVQDNHSYSRRGVLRGIHYQIRQPQGKLVRAGRGAVLDVAVDLRRSSPAFGRWVAVELSAENKRQLWVPEGCGHGFSVLSADAELLYKATDYYAPEHERTIAWDDPALGIDWRLDVTGPVLSDKDRAGTPFRDAEVYH